MERAEFLNCLSPAKLNLFLHITERRMDGYHTLQTYFQLLDYGDELKFTCLTNPTIQLQTSLTGLNTQDNLIYRAARLLQNHTQTSLGASILLNKKIPLGAGLGGGSSNAGMTLVALDQLWQTHCSIAELQQIALQLGADVPLFVLGHSAWAEGIGEQLTPLKSADDWFLVVTPKIHVSTPVIFHHPRLTRNTPPIRVSTACKDGSFVFCEKTMRNDCQTLVRELHPEIAELLTWLSDFGLARLTGTGASCFIQFATQAQAAKVQKHLPYHWQSFIARGISNSPLHQMILDSKTIF